MLERQTDAALSECARRKLATFRSDTSGVAVGWDRAWLTIASLRDPDMLWILDWIAATYLTPDLLSQRYIISLSCLAFSFLDHSSYLKRSGSCAWFRPISFISPYRVFFVFAYDISLIDMYLIPQLARICCSRLRLILGVFATFYKVLVGNEPGLIRLPLRYQLPHWRIQAQNRHKRYVRSR